MVTSRSIHERAAGSFDAKTSELEYADRRCRRPATEGAAAIAVWLLARPSELSRGRARLLGDEVLRFGVGNDDRGCALLGFELELLGQADADATEVE